MGARMRTRPIARKGEGAPSRKHKREHSKSGIRLNCQRKTRGAANRAAKSVTGKARVRVIRDDYPLADWERRLLQESGEL